MDGVRVGGGVSVNTTVGGTAVVATGISTGWVAEGEMVKVAVGVIWAALLALRSIIKPMQ